MLLQNVFFSIDNIMKVDIVINNGYTKLNLYILQFNKVDGANINVQLEA